MVAAVGMFFDRWDSLVAMMVFTAVQVVAARGD